MTVVLTKADLAENDEQVEEVRAQVRALTGPDVETLVVSALDPQSVEAVRELVPPGSMAVLVGKSGVGKSSLVNLLVGADVQETAAVREADGKGRHTTVSREMIEVPGGGRVVDMPGVRGLGLWTPMRVSMPRSPTSKRRRRAAVSATASIRTSRDAPCAPGLARAGAAGRLLPLHPTCLLTAFAHGRRLLLERAVRLPPLGR